MFWFFKKDWNCISGVSGCFGLSLLHWQLVKEAEGWRNPDSRGVFLGGVVVCFFPGTCHSFCCYRSLALVSFCIFERNIAPGNEKRTVPLERCVQYPIAFFCTRKKLDIRLAFWCLKKPGKHSVPRNSLKPIIAVIKKSFACELPLLVNGSLVLLVKQVFVLHWDHLDVCVLYSAI